MCVCGIGFCLDKTRTLIVDNGTYCGIQGVSYLVDRKCLLGVAKPVEKEHKGVFS